MSKSVSVPEMAKQTESAPSHWTWVDRTIWTERMLAALGNGVKGSKWSTMAKGVLRKLGTVHHGSSPSVSEPIPMRKPLTGEPCAGEPLALYGGRGGRCPSLPLYTRPDLIILTSKKYT
jgi:hypothetical protein